MIKKVTYLLISNYIVLQVLACKARKFEFTLLLNKLTLIIFRLIRISAVSHCQTL